MLTDPRDPKTGLEHFWPTNIAPLHRLHMMHLRKVYTKSLLFSTELSKTESQNRSRRMLQTCSAELIFEPGTVHALGFEELQSIAPPGYTSMLHQPQKVGFASNIFPMQSSIGFHCKYNRNFEQMRSIFCSTTYRCRWKLIFWGFKVPISTIDWWNMSFQLPRNPEIRDLTYFAFNWKSKEHQCKPPISMLTLKNIAREPNFLGLLRHGGVSGGAIDCNSSKPNAWTVPGSNISSAEQVWNILWERFWLSVFDNSVLKSKDVVYTFLRCITWQSPYATRHR